MLVSMLHVCYSGRGEIVAYHIVWQDHFGDWQTVCTGHILRCVKTTHIGMRFVQLRTHAVAEQLSKTSKQFMPEFLELSGYHFRKVKSSHHPKDERRKNSAPEFHDTRVKTPLMLFQVCYVGLFCLPRVLFAMLI